MRDLPLVLRRLAWCMELGIRTEGDARSSPLLSSSSAATSSGSEPDPGLNGSSNAPPP